MKAVILAGGRGTRISEESVTKPKPLVEIGGRPIIWHIMSLYAHHGITDFIVCAGYKGYLLKEYFINLLLHHSDVTVDLATNSVAYHSPTAQPWRVTVVDTGLNTQTGGRIKRIAPHLDPAEPFCLTYGDGVADIDLGALLAFHHRHGRLATMTVVTPPARFGAVAMAGDRITAFAEKPVGGEGLINGGFFVLHPEVINYIADDDMPWEKEPLDRLARGGQLVGYRHSGFWQPMDTLREKELLETLWDGGHAPWRVWR